MEYNPAIFGTNKNSPILNYTVLERDFVALSVSPLKTGHDGLQCIMKTEKGSLMAGMWKTNS